MKSIIQRLNEAPILLLDGAMGTELFRRGVQTQLPLWSAQALVENPQIVRRIHEDYIRAGAEIITTNTFRTTSRALNKKGLSTQAKQLTDLAVTLAKQARDAAADQPLWIAGSVAPLEDCYEPDLVPDPETAFGEHSELIQRLAESGVDLILIETMNTIQETVAAARAAQTHGLPIFISWTCGSDSEILNGDSIQAGIRSLQPYNPSAFLVNCTPCNNIGPALQKMHEVSKVPIGAYANIGKPEPVNGWEFTFDLDATAYALEAEKWVQLGAKIVGGCCGTTPEHISALKNLKA
ncbi:MAG TPA: homocysteine S-methyltransferase family protein [Acidobacteriota bacterium]|nr:homocysteine S-methyltransferase family protein [Acidobacteriota bacterium]